MDKLRAWISTIKEALLYVIGPIVALFLYITYLKDKNQELADKLESAHFDENEEKLKDEQAKDDGQSADAIAYYQQLRSAYLSTGDKGGGPSDSGAAKADPDQGPKN